MSLSLLTSDAYASLEHSISPRSDDSPCRLWKPNHEPQNDHEDFVIPWNLSFTPEINQLDDLTATPDGDYSSTAVVRFFFLAIRLILSDSDLRVPCIPH